MKAFGNHTTNQMASSRISSDFGSAREHALKPINVCRGMINAGIKAGVAFVSAIALLGLFGPTVAATGEYLIGPRQLSCDNYDIRIPLSWKASLKRCDRVVLLERRSNLLFDSGSSHDLMFIESLVRQHSTPDQEEIEFRNAYPAGSASPMRVSNDFSRCLRVNLEPNGSWISVTCVDASDRLEFNFFGPEADLNDAVSLIKLRQ